MLYIETSRETYAVDNDGMISRPKLGIAIPSGQWRFVGMVRRNNFGHQVEFVPFGAVANFFHNRATRHANGKAKWFVRDWDHGTVREWRSETVSRIYTP